MIETQGSVRAVAMAPASRALTTLDRVDYEDSFIVETDKAQDRTAEEWARATLEDAPPAMRRTLRRGWYSLGLRLGSTDDTQRVLGWEVHRSTPDYTLLAVSSRLGMQGELLFQRHNRALFFATFLQLENPAARTVWAGVAPVHRRVVQHLLEQVLQRLS